jgi:fructose-bisphosphate aldolase, class II
MLLNALQSRQLFTHALEHRYAILAVNADSASCITDVLEAARESDAPVIIETSLWQLKGRSFGAGSASLGMARYMVQIAQMANSEPYKNVPVLYHTDHIKGPEAIALLKNAIRGLETRIMDVTVPLRPSTVSLDSSDFSEEDNIKHTLSLCQTAQEAGVPVTLEMEAGVDDGLTPLDLGERLLTGVESQAPGCIYLWAPGVGTQHGLQEDGSSFSSQTVAAHQQLASQIAGHPVGIALHGSSGLPEKALLDAVAAGVVKVNWSSESLLIRSRAALEYFVQSKQQLERNHPKWKDTAQDNGMNSFIADKYVGKVRERMRVLGGNGHGAAFMRLLEG